MHLIIEGRVQGVTFRYHLSRKAEELSVNGWVKNLSSGEIEAVLEGEETNVRSLLEWCAQGPPWAGVKKVRSWEEDATKEFKRFEIRW